MTGYYKVLDGLRNELLSNPFVNVVTDGLGDDIDLSKQTIFPLSHIVILTAQPIDNIVTFTVDVYCMDIVDIDDIGSPVNLHDVLNTQYNVCLRMYSSLRRGDLWDDGIEISSINLESFEQAYENYLAGWRMSLTVEVPNHMSIC